MPSDHVHEQLRGTVGCRDCKLVETLGWWAGYREAQEDIIANGLPGHEERVAAAGNELWDEEKARMAIASYSAPLPPKEE